MKAEFKAIWEICRQYGNAESANNVYYVKTVNRNGSYVEQGLFRWNKSKPVCTAELIDVHGIVGGVHV